MLITVIVSIDYCYTIYIYYRVTGDGNFSESGRIKGRKRELAGVGNREKAHANIFVIFCNRNITKEAGAKPEGTGSGSISRTLNFPQ